MHNIKKITGRYLNNNNQTYDIQKKKEKSVIVNHIFFEEQTVHKNIQ